MPDSAEIEFVPFFVYREDVPQVKVYFGPTPPADTSAFWIDTNEIDDPTNQP